MVLYSPKERIYAVNMFSLIDSKVPLFDIMLWKTNTFSTKYREWGKSKYTVVSARNRVYSYIISIILVIIGLFFIHTTVNLFLSHSVYF